MTTLARHHAYWWDHPALSSGRFEVGHWSRDRTQLGLYVERRTAAWARIDRSALTSPTIALYDEVLAGLDRHWQVALAPHFAPARDLTLGHGDAYFANFLCSTDGSGTTYLIDWQGPEADHCGNDLANLLATFWTHEQRHEDGREHECLGVYHRTLVESGVEGYAWDDLLLDYRAGSCTGCSSGPGRGGRIGPGVLAAEAALPGVRGPRLGLSRPAALGEALDEGRDLGDGPLVALEVGHVGDAGQLDEPGARDGGGSVGAVLADVAQVVLADQQQRRYGDLGEPVPAGTSSRRSPGSSASRARPFISRKRSRGAPGTRPSGAVGPSSQTRASSRFTVARSPRSSAASHSSSSASTSGSYVGSGAPLIAGPISTSARTRSGWVSARSSEVRPPIEAPMTTAGVGVVGVEHGDGVVDRRPAVLRLVRRPPVAARVVGQAPVAGSRSTT